VLLQVPQSVDTHFKKGIVSATGLASFYASPQKYNGLAVKATCAQTPLHPPKATDIMARRNRDVSTIRLLLTDSLQWA
jgi:hypothetical protein